MIANRLACRPVALCFLACALLASFEACSGAGSGKSQLTSGGSGGGAADGGPGGDGGLILQDGSGMDPTEASTLAESGACAADSHPGQVVPLDILILLDQSKSMSSNQEKEDRWTPVVSAISEFISDPRTNGMGVGLQYFPIPPRPGTSVPSSCKVESDCGFYGPCLVFQCSEGFLSYVTCDPEDYAAPEVEIVELPGAKDAILDSLDAHTPATGDATTSQPALEGALRHMSAWVSDHPSHIGNVLFATDGEPNYCKDNTLEGAAPLAEAAANAAVPVKTYVLGIGDQMDGLKQVAEKGGTGHAYYAGSGQVAEKLIEVLNEIRAQGLCQFQVPVPASGTPDYARVNVDYADSEGGRKTLAKVADPSQCDPTDGGWYYDSEAQPTKILLCDATCDVVKLSTEPVNILLGCQTIVR